MVMKTAIIVLILTLIGCSKNDPSPISPFLGKWKVISAALFGCPFGNGQLNITNAEFNFTAIPRTGIHGYYIMNEAGNNSGSYKFSGDSIYFSETYKGTWRLTGSVLTFSLIDYGRSNTCLTTIALTR